MDNDKIYEMCKNVINAKHRFDYKQMIYEIFGGCEPEIVETYLDKYRDYKNRAKRKSIKFTISFLDFLTAVTGGCYICGKDGMTNIVGVDRVNNKRGYEFNNISGCCWDCNRMKSNGTVPYFKEYMNRLNPTNSIFSTELTPHKKDPTFDINTYLKQIALAKP